MKEFKIFFKKGPLGFEKNLEFIVKASNSDYFMILESCSEDLAFVLTSPFYFDKNYSPNFEIDVAKELELKEKEDLEIFCIANINVESHKEITANFRAPILINKKTLEATQEICKNEEYSMVKSLFKEF